MIYKMKKVSSLLRFVHNNNYNRILLRTRRDASLGNNFCTASRGEKETNTKSLFNAKLSSGPGLGDFIAKGDSSPNSEISTENVDIPYLYDAVYTLPRKKVYFYVYGCQMNVNDTEVVWAILKQNNYLKTDILEEADVILIVTCAIRDSAEVKIWHRLDELRAVKKRRTNALPPLKIGLLGCMAERLKHQLLDTDKIVDIVAGPDSYKDLPRLLNDADNNQTAINVMLSLDETYADVMPVRLNSESKSAYVSIMRGCDNMCTYCIVPFTRGWERSRPIESIIGEIKQLSQQGVKEVTLLGQNVNSYRDVSQETNDAGMTNTARGFKTVYKPKKGGMRFADLLDQVSQVDSEMRIRFTSPHPKDFPDEVLTVIKERPNICKFLHLPAQAGSSAVLERMRRGYTREAYLELVDHIRNILPTVSFSTDIICGFCQETEEEFQETLTLMEKVKFNIAYTFAYSMREKTAAHRRYEDDIPYSVKERRLREAASLYRREAEKLNKACVGDVQIVLIEGKSRRSDSMLAGRNDGNIKVIIPNVEVPMNPKNTACKSIIPGDYIAVKIESSTSQSLKGIPLFHCTLKSFHDMHLDLHHELHNSQVAV